jgi:hypothetical protein
MRMKRELGLGNENIGKEMWKCGEDINVKNV